MQVETLYEWLAKHARLIHMVMVPLLVLMLISVGLVVYHTGGIKYVYSHTMYIPIVFSAVIYGVRGGILVALVGALIVGPFMPINTETGEMQQPANWLYRTGIFVLIGTVIGLASDSFRSYINHLLWLTRHDNATKLPNRSALLEALKQLTTAPAAAHHHVLMMLSLHHAQSLKADLGHKIIESVIHQIALRFNYTLPKNTIIYRTDTEQVSVILTNSDHAKIRLLLEQLKAIAHSPFLYEGIPVHIDSRIGYVLFESSEQPELLLQQAESALNHAHQTAQDNVVYQPAMKSATKETVQLLGELMKAIEQHQLLLHFQPIIDARTGEVLSVEALMRWNHPAKGAIDPTTFIPCAEQSTLIHPITHFALEEAIRTALYFQALDITLPIAVNVSAHNLSQPHFVETVLDLLTQYHLDGKYLELEITESALMQDIHHSVLQLNKLANAGISITIDDFGTGYSSLQYLHQLPISQLKIDKSFVIGLPDNQDVLPILEAAISMAHKMAIKVTAEGIENAAALAIVKQFGCDAVQGYYIAKPVSRQQLANWYFNYQQTQHPVINESFVR